MIRGSQCHARQSPKTLLVGFDDVRKFEQDSLSLDRSHFAPRGISCKSQVGVPDSLIYVIITSDRNLVTDQISSGGVVYRYPALQLDLLVGKYHI